MQTARDYLADRNLAKRGTRGKFSNAAHKALDEALASGVKFSDWPKDGKVVKVTAPAQSAGQATPAVKVSPEYADYMFADDFRYPEKDFKALDGKGKEVGMREVCNNCRVSLVSHNCDSPVILGDVSVRLVAR